MFCRREKLDQAKRTSQDNDRWLREDMKRKNGVHTLLLLGTGESGKTTIIKQMKIIHINGFTDDEKREKIPFIYQNIRECIHDIVLNMDKISPPEILDEINSKKSREYILDLGLTNDLEYNDVFFDHVQTLWNDNGVKRTFKRSNEYQLIDSAAHFLDRIEAVRQKDYIPTVQDILFCRIKTVTISKIEFSIPVPLKYGGGSANFWMFDVGGQRGERRKWISVFEGIETVLFLIAASDFDQKLREDESKNRLQEAFELFENMFWSRFLRDSGMIVFLNKQDLLQQKIESGRSFSKYFPDFRAYNPKNEQSKNKYEKCKYFMRQRLLDISKTKPEPESIGLIPGVHIRAEIPDRDVYIHFTIATDTNNIKLVFDSVRDMILTKNLQSTLF